MISRTTAGVVAGVAGTLFIGYCIYFDRKRRSDPLFRQKLKERRRLRGEQSSKTSSGSSGEGQKLEIPDLKDAEAVQSFFLQQVQRGEQLLAEGDFENGVEHLSNAVAVCGQPQQLLQVLHQTLPAPVFQLLVHKLPATSKKIAALSEARSSSSGATVKELDDLE
ncbi:mitochondrial import receptor subunit TOM20 homolog [Lytechinus variegatus]|uniref:mitochondrial import receptor subunit TOM20 homolog n=1 Tax=Lytechinus variegatus TaxID=7654 RepID=UPI001BB118FE|nr:mitochondrial import receptor subunit TOM20 homolog [Lytechinus variegatus]